MLSKTIKVSRCILASSQPVRAYQPEGNTVYGKYTKVLSEHTIDPKVKDCQYAVRGAIPIRGGEISSRIRDGDLSYPFTKITALNIGNPQAVGQGFISYNRDIISALLNPDLLDSDLICEDAKKRVTHMNTLFTTPIGGYTNNSKGHAQVRQAIEKYIDNRDGHHVHADWNNIFLTNGASEGVRIMLKMLLRNKQDGVMVPIPQYPLYSALLTLDGGTMIKYYLDEEKNWGINPEEIEQNMKNAKDLGINVRAMVVINPGNPTGQVLRRNDIEDIIRICHK